MKALAKTHKTMEDIMKKRNIIAITVIALAGTVGIAEGAPRRQA